ncbi:HWE histidine kinase domain-containing protein [Brevundimonas sp. SORGH_AS_0993]|uniref:HWE histidine kinase domain-containing protein n=1 Tax=Brevundimonas sp. SORGH_AS_0993 TaxID=3041794 RepID=UPI00277F1FBB|nr:HWE histidine kinase domain-containing protein [Brevundimonas sp. SORGH_AS_0993]MDQ1154480.1 light-regulated signal transduction histidine kinase (bacteriophytochrome)/CheY-like chemotaxis protein [Brevundimonas sp. SORGH_AS_0993]
MTDSPFGSVDLTNCDREPIHLLGAIQPIGFLLVLTQDWMVERASANIEEFLGLTAQEVIGRPLDGLFDDEAIHTLRNRVTMLRGVDAVERMFHHPLMPGRPPFDIAVHVSDGRIVIEAQPSSELSGDATNTVRSMIARLDQAPDLMRFLDEGARLVRALTGIDRVMIYRFAEDGSGEVAAESAKAGIGSFKGLHYPASDIPRQARELYRRNLLRIICDIEAAPVPVLPARDGEGRLLDLSLSVLRSVSPIHIEYLRNMDVRASMSISIIVDDRLWGLFACHHYSPMAPSFERRSVYELLAQMFSMRLESRERKELVEFERRARDIADQLLGAVASDDTLLNDPDWLSEILTSAIPADGVGVWINGSHAFSGVTPDAGTFRRIVARLTEISPDRVYGADQISRLVPDAPPSEAAGLLAIPISRAAPNFVILFRQELIRSVRWGGDPHKPVEYGPNGPRLTPRASFEEWKETVVGRARDFSASEKRVAETLRATLIEVVLRMADEATIQRQQANERQELLIAELNHRVRNILGIIRGLIRQSKPHDNSIESFVTMVDGRIHALARAHNQITDDHWGPAPLQALIDAEAAAFLAEGPERIRSTGGHVLLNPQAYSTMALVIHELVTNSAKYGSLSDSGLVDIDWRFNPAGDLLVEWREQGGPPVRPPSRKGFGSTIIDRSVPYDLGGESSIDYPPEGVIVRLRIPARHVSERGRDQARSIRFPRTSIGHPTPPPTTILKGQRMLLVEDSLIIAMDAEDVLNRLGAASVLTASTVDAALDFIAASPPTLAVLDINLGDHTSYPVANRLKELGVPFLFASGYGEQAKLPAAHADRPILQKPYTLENVARALDALVAPDAAED